MSDGDLFGVQGLTLDQARAKLQEALGVELEARDSNLHGGDYYVVAPERWLRLQPNLTDPRDPEDLAEPEHADYPVLVYVLEEVPDRAATCAALEALPELTRLEGEPVGEAPAPAPAAEGVEQPVERIEAEEIADQSPRWTIELYPDRLRFRGPDGTDRALPREGIRGQVDLVMGLTLRRILLAPLRGDPKRKDGLRFEPEAWETLTAWIGWPRQEDLSFQLQRRTSTGALIGFVFAVSPFLNRAANASAARDIYLLLGLWLIGVWLLAKVWPRRILFLLDSGAYAVIAMGLASAMKAGTTVLGTILFLLCVGLILSGFNHYKTHRVLRSGPSGSA